jgi:hypothetical protein
MYLAIITLPLLGSIASGLFGRKIGVTGAQLITSSLVILTTLLAIAAYFEVGLNSIPVSIKLFTWIDSESLNVFIGFHFDSLTMSMLLKNKEPNKLFSSSSVRQSPFDFKLFYSKFSEFYPGLIPPTPGFLEWFIGFSEGEGCFTVAKRGDFTFVITQSSVDVQVLTYIQQNLGFGTVGVASAKLKTHRYLVQDRTNITLLCLLFNGNMVLPTRSARFITFLSSFNEKLIKRNLTPISPITRNILPSLNDYWLSGFVDGEGCFSITLLSTSVRFRISFIITQKWEANKFAFEHILSLFDCNGSILLRKNSDY